MTYTPTDEQARELGRVMQREMGSFLAHDPAFPDYFWTNQARAVLAAAGPMSDDHTPSTDEVRERPTIALAREIAGWDQDAPGTTRISHWAVNLAAYLLNKGYAHAESVRAEERERIARDLHDEAVVVDEFGNHGLWIEDAVRIAREGA